MVMLLSRFFRLGTPVLVILCTFGDVPWWLILTPVMPVWWSMVTTTHDAHRRAMIIRRPSRSMGLEEASAERKFHRIDSALVQAEINRAEALAELAHARAWASTSRHPDG